MNTRPPTSPTVRSRWTPRDEATLQEFTERKDRIMRENREPVVAFLRMNAVSADSDFVGWLIANADAIRDVLEPFDSGDRPARPA